MFSLYQFDTEYESVIENKHINEVGDIDLIPRGCTALLDAMGRTINAMASRITDGRKTLMVVITDGHENSSHEFKKSQILDMIKTKKDTGWDFVFLGANQDAIDEAAQLGIGVNQSLTYSATPKGVNNMSASLCNYAASYRSEGSASFSQADRDKQN